MPWSASYTLEAIIYAVVVACRRDAVGWELLDGSCWKVIAYGIAKWELWGRNAGRRCDGDVGCEGVGMGMGSEDEGGEYAKNNSRPLWVTSRL